MARFIFSSIFAFVLLLHSGAHAAFWDRGGGLIYDDILGITWLQDANYPFTSGYVMRTV